jgi:hypothetical protein
VCEEIGERGILFRGQKGSGILLFTSDKEGSTCAVANIEGAAISGAESTENRRASTGTGGICE